MFDDFDRSFFDSPEFKEDSVREVIIAPLLQRLGYRVSGQDRIVRSKTLAHPFIYVGTRKHPVTIVPDYTLFHDEQAILVLDAKSPGEDILKQSHIQQAYSYCVHPEVRSKHFALCNGRLLAVFHVEMPQPLLLLPFEEFEVRWPEVEKHLAPKFLLQPELRKFAPDLGFKFAHLGISPDTKLVMLGVRPDLFARVNDGLYTASGNCDFGGEAHCASFDFAPNLLPVISAGLPECLHEPFNNALARAPFQVSAECAIELDLSVRLGAETRGAHDTFVPLEINEVLAARFNPEPVGDDPTDIPSHVFRLRKAFRIVSREDKSARE